MKMEDKAKEMNDHMVKETKTPSMEKMMQEMMGKMNTMMAMMQGITGTKK